MNTTDKFEIGRYEPASDVSRSAFLTMGVMNASLNNDGKWPAASEQLNKSVKYGATKSMTCLDRETEATLRQHEATM